ncbi:MAG: hypothetical protein RJA20_2422 [Bacteroidota bacterium]|jgi:uncharacterized membrane protein YedE/YeeE
MELLSKPWPWWVAGTFIGLLVPTLLILGNKHFGVSSNLRHICAACFPANISFFKYDWKKEIWNFFFVGGILAGGVIAAVFLNASEPVQVHPELVSNLSDYGVGQPQGLLPADLFSFDSLLTLRGFIIMVIGGFLVGFGTRYAGGCTSGHAIMGLSNLQWPSLIATIAFMVGGFVMTHLFLPLILSL